jgi:hypothetical protein
MVIDPIKWIVRAFFILLICLILSVFMTVFGQSREVYRIDGWRCQGTHGGTVCDIGSITIDIVEGGNAGIITLRSRYLTGEFNFYNRTEIKKKIHGYQVFDVYARPSVFVVDQYTPYIYWIQWVNDVEHIIEFKIYGNEGGKRNRKT